MGSGGSRPHRRDVTQRSDLQTQALHPEATAANGTWGIQIQLELDQSDKGGVAI